VNEVEQTGQINVPSEGLWDIGSPMGSPNNEKVTPISKNRAPPRLSFWLRDGCDQRLSQSTTVMCGLDVATPCREGEHGQTKNGAGTGRK
jgi:hypothetical protein